jgi:NitT/TauT family transport system ATP-binding protein
MVLMEPKLRVEKASKVYAGKSGAVHALEDLSLDVAEGELITILGPSGCGKTTLLWAMSGLHALTSGRITLDGTEVNGPRPHEIGMIFQ